MSDLGPQLRPPQSETALKIFYETQLIYNVVLISAVLQSDSVICISTFFFRFFSIVVYHRIFKKLHFNMIFKWFMYQLWELKYGIFFFSFSLCIFLFVQVFYILNWTVGSLRARGQYSLLSIHKYTLHRKRHIIYFLMSYSIHIKILDH